MTKRLKRIARFIVVLLCLAALVVGAAMLVRRKKAALAEAPRYGLAPTPVRVAQAQRGSLEITRDYLAIVEPARRANLTARITSRVESVAADEGQIVDADRPLILLDDREIVNAIEVARAQIAQAEAELGANEATVSSLEKSAAFWTREAQRMREALERGAATASETEAAIDKASQLAGQLTAARRKSDALGRQVKALESRVDELNTRKSYCSISSPFEGVVAQRHVDPGDQASPGKVLMVVEDRSHLKLAFDIPQQDIPLVSVGRTVRFAGPDGRREATVANLFPSLNNARMLRAEVVLEDPAGEGLDSGAYMPVTMVLETKEDVTLVPSSAVIESPAGRPTVFVVAEGKLQAIEVTLLGRNGDRTAVEGVQPGADVVLSTFLGWSRLSAGLSVEAIR
jgi:RND family efflux transporter MFP subunit